MRISDWSSDVCSSDLRDRQSQGLPERGREVRVTDKSQQSRQEPVVDVLRENPRSDRAADVQPGGRPAARHQLRFEEGQRNREEARCVRRADDRAGLYRTAGQATGRMVYAREEGRLDRKSIV